MWTSWPACRTRSATRNYAITSTPVVVRNVVIHGSNIGDGAQNKEGPRGDVSGYDVRTGKQAWTFRSVPSPGEFGNDTWENDSWTYTGNTNVWSLISADEDARLRLPAVRHADQRLLRRRSPGRRPVRRKPRLPRRHDRQTRVALPERPSRPVGLRLPRGADPRRHHGQRPPDQRRRAGQQTGIRLRVRSAHRPAGVADRRAAGSAFNGAR